MVKKKSKKGAAEPAISVLPFAESGWDSQVQSRISRIRTKNKASLLKKVKHTLIPSHKINKKQQNALDGSDVGAVHPTKEVTRLVEELQEEPSAIDKRVRLVSIISQVQRDYSLETYRRLLLQSMTPLYLGDFSPVALQLVVKTYRVYLTKLCAYHQQQLLETNSDQLKGVKYSNIRMPALSEAKSDKEVELIKELKIAEGLLEKSKAVPTIIQNKLRLPLAMAELDELIKEGGEEEEESGPVDNKSQFKVDVSAARAAIFEGGDIQASASQSINRNVVLKKAVSVIDILKSIPLLHPVALELLEKVKLVGIAKNLLYVLEGRIHMQAVQYYLLQMEAGDNSSQELVTPTFNKAVVAYRTAMKTFKRSRAGQKDISLLVEFASLTHYAFSCRRMMKLSKEGVRMLLKEGKKAVDIAVMLDPSHAGLQMRLATVLES